MFPEEIFEEIFKHCDPVDLLRYKSVCSTWNSMIPRIINQQTDIWYRKCLSDVPKTMWSSMVDTRMVPAFDPFDYHKAKDHPCIWIKLWRSWIRWRKLIHMEVSVETFDPLSNCISNSYINCIRCIALQNNIIAFVSQSNQIMLFNITNNDIVGIIDCAETFDGTLLRDVHLFGTDECIGVMAAGLDHCHRLYTVTNKVVRDYQYWELDWICANICNGYIVMISVHRLFTKLATITTLGGELVQTERELPYIYRLDFHDHVTAFEVCGDQYLMWTYQHIYCMGRFDHKPIFHRVRHPRVRMTYYRTFKPLVVAGISGEYRQTGGELKSFNDALFNFGEFGFFNLESHEWKKYNLMEKFGAPVTTVLFHVGILALGLKSGEVHIFDVKDVANLQHLDFGKMESKMVRLSSRPIMSLKVTEHDSTPYIVAATLTHVHFIKFGSS